MIPSVRGRKWKHNSVGVERGRTVLVAALDLVEPAAIELLQIKGELDVRGYG